MTHEISPYDEMIEKISYLIKAYDRLNQRIIDHTDIIENLADRISKIERKLNPENPGDINHLYQNWNRESDK